MPAVWVAPWPNDGGKSNRRATLLGTGMREPSSKECVDDSLSDERFLADDNNNSNSNNNNTGSWESLEGRPSSSTRDRRKQFDTTTPTLVDEDYEQDDEEVLLSASPVRRSLYNSTPDSMGAMRRTPGAMAMQRAAAQAEQEERQQQLGFGLLLSTPIANAQQQQQTTANNERPPSQPRGPFSFAPTWGTQENRAFSPNILRLTEDIGNLLHEDEDDDYALEIPSVFRGHGEALSDVPEDWTGSFMFETATSANSNYARRQRPAVPRPSTFVKEKSRRRPATNNPTQQQQQQQHRKNAEETLEFGKQRDERASPQLLNFGGAFGPPPAKEFMRPVAYAPASETKTTGSAHLANYGGFQPTNFENYTNAQTRAFQPQNNEAFFAPSAGAFSGLSQGMMHTLDQLEASRNQRSSEMQATAREFVPMASTSSNMRGTTTQDQQWNQAPSYDPGIHSWQPVGINYGFDPMYGGMPSNFVDPRVGMSPSPHLQPWQSPDHSLYATSPSPIIMDHGLVPSMSQAISSESSYGQQTRMKKDMKRGKRGKKKTKPEKSVASAPTTASSARTKKRGETPRPGSTVTTASQEGGADDAQLSAMEDTTDAKRAELVESPSTRVAFKEFYRAFRSEEKVSHQKAEEYALYALESGALPESVHWRVYLELADLAKRSNRYSEARRLYQKVCQLQPYASQGWLEYSKLEEECGHMNRVTNILHAGLEYCEYSENLLTRAVKHQEKMGNLRTARELLARLKHIGIDKVWKTVLEGALLEARVGNYATARRVLKYLMHHVPWYGPLYLEAYKLERDLGNPEDALEIVERGLCTIPKYGPLWFGGFRLCEDTDIGEKSFHLPKTTLMLDRAVHAISKELAWKVHLEAAHIFERAALEHASEARVDVNVLLAPARFRYTMTTLTVPVNLRWKVLLSAARMELGAGNSEKARSLFLRAHEVSPEKGRPNTLLECARYEEFVGNVAAARAILCRGRVDYWHDWKVWLESVLVEIRNGDSSRAFEICANGLEIHQGTGRLWATLIQLSHTFGGDAAQLVALRRALNAVPKSGEVWCEGARVHLNPFSATFDIDRARRHLFFATKFTPQYGDSFVEIIRLEILSQWLMPIAEYIWNKTNGSFVQPNETREEGLTKFITDISLAIFVSRGVDRDISSNLPKVVHREIVTTVRKRLKADSLSSVIDLSEVQRTCGNADPNYGTLWFYCRRTPTDSPRRVVEYAAAMIAQEVKSYAHIYLAAMVRRLAVLSTLGKDRPGARNYGGLEVIDPDLVSFERELDDALVDAPSLKNIFTPLDPTTGSVLVESSTKGSDFATGLMGLNTHHPTQRMALLERRKALFGTDALFPS